MKLSHCVNCVGEAPLGVSFFLADHRAARQQPSIAHKGGWIGPAVIVAA